MNGAGQKEEAFAMPARRSGLTATKLAQGSLRQININS
jgi:hypothetical protein